MVRFSMTMELFSKQPLHQTTALQADLRLVSLVFSMLECEGVSPERQELLKRQKRRRDLREEAAGCGPVWREDVLTV